MKAKAARQHPERWPPARCLVKVKHISKIYHKTLSKDVCLDKY